MNAGDVPVTTDCATLNYASGNRRQHWVAKHKKMLIAFALLAGVIVIGVRYRLQIERYYTWHRLHSEVAAYQMPSGLASIDPPDDEMGASGTKTVSPAQLTALAAIDPDVAAQLAGPWKRMYGVPKDFGYVGQRRRPDGAWRTVVLTPVGRLSSELFHHTVVAVIERPSWWSFTPPTLARSIPQWQGDGSEGIIVPYNTVVRADPSDERAVIIEISAAKSWERAFPETCRFRAILQNDDSVVWEKNGAPCGSPCPLPQPR